MSPFLRIGFCSLVLATSAWTIGCGSGSAEKAKSPDTSTGQKDEHAGHHSDATAAEIEAALAKLSPEDRALAEKQKVCPVSGDMLGAMDAPIKLNVKGNDVFICCDGCKDPVMSEPDKYLAKLGLTPKEGP